MRLVVRQVVVVVDGRCQTESYTYRLQEGDSMESWLVRWEYQREPPRADYVYPLAHVHVRGELPSGKSADRLHIPTRRVPLERAAIRHYCEQRVPPHALDKLRVEAVVDRGAVTIVERRPPWREDFGPEWTEQGIARLRWTGTHGEWTEQERCFYAGYFVMPEEGLEPPTRGL